MMHRLKTKIVVRIQWKSRVTILVKKALKLNESVKLMLKLDNISSVTGALEGQVFRKTGKLPSLSEQQLVDCSTKFGNYGCDGGLEDMAFLYTMTVKGLMSEKDYPYTAEDGECQYNPKKVLEILHD